MIFLDNLFDYFSFTFISRLDMALKSGIMFKLNQFSRQKRSFVFGDWYVEISDHNYILAYTEGVHDHASLLTTGQEMCNRALDIYSVERRGTLRIEEPFQQYIAFVNDEKGASVFINVLNHQFPRYYPNDPPLHGGFICYRGKRTEWDVFLRYYRYSKTSTNVFDAYRWMFLMLEALAERIEPQRRNSEGKLAERETPWLIRALQKAEKDYKWTNVVDWGTKPIEHFMKEHYHLYRGKLFHAKTYDLISSTGQFAVHNALLSLEQLCVFLLEKVCPIEERVGYTDPLREAGTLTGIFREADAFLCKLDLSQTPDRARTWEIPKNPLLIPWAGNCFFTTSYAEIYQGIFKLDSDYTVQTCGILSEEYGVFAGWRFDKMPLYIEAGWCHVELTLHTPLLHPEETRNCF